jgi:GNAT superfamily N-acetyltransferase
MFHIFRAKRKNNFVICLEAVHVCVAFGKLCGFRCIVRTFIGHAKSMLPSKRNSRHESLGKMVMGIEIRKAVPLDAAAACALLRRSIEQGCAPDHRGRPEILENWLANKNPDNVAAWFASPTNYAIVAERDGEMLGLALLTQAGKLALCYVEPDALRIGVGRALLAAVEEQARAWNIGKLHLQSPTSTATFFERHGYANAGLEKACFGLECSLMWKQLDADPLATDAKSGDARRKRFCNCSQ